MWQINATEAHVHVTFSAPQWVLSSAVLNGGLTQTDHILNMKVPKDPHLKSPRLDPPEVTLAQYARRLHLPGQVVGMMTSAFMSTFRQASVEEQGTEVTALVTAGISNAKRAGEPAEWRRLESGLYSPGTINIITLTNALLTPAALVEAAITVTEAKAVALDQLGVTSPQTGVRATGTGTDAVAIAGGFGPPTVRFCGKHALFGEMLAAATIQALTQSLQRK